MSIIPKIVAFIVLPLALSVAGCDSGSTGPATAPPQDELTKFLADNPDVANAEQEQGEEGEGASE